VTRDDAVLPHRFQPGSVIAGKYRVERLIGQGGMGVVLAARHLGLDEMVAVKLIREGVAEGSQALARFQREARAAARIKSEHVARVLDVDRLPEGEPYIVMELIDGTDLHALTKRRGALEHGDAAHYILQACEGLAEAHALGMVHRDLKLKNLFLTRRRDGRPLIKVIDFGVVKLTRDADPPASRSSPDGPTHAAQTEVTLTGAAMLVGSVHYMAPEQIRASNVVDARADVWSLGVCLYSLLTTQLPFDGDNVMAICAAIQGRPAPDVRLPAPDIPPRLAEAVARALEKDPRRRFANVGELARALEPFGPDRAAASRIETILQSSAGETLPLPYDDTVAAGPADPDDHSTLHSGAGARRAVARVESTIDAAAASVRLGVPSSRPPPAQSRRMVTGAVALVLAAGATFMIGFRTRPQPAEEPVVATSAPQAILPSATSPIPATPTESATSSASPSPMPPIAVPVKPPKHAPSRGVRATTPARSAPPAAAASTPQPPKPEPTNAYDHF
jgi:serine/threonine-protein kinase